MAGIEEFIQTYYLGPLCSYYTPVGSLTYGLLLAVAVWGVYKLLQKLKIDINKYLFIGLLPFIVYGGWTRALRDHGLYSGQLFCSPPIYFFIFFLALGSLLLAVGIERKFKIPYWKVLLGLGLVPLIYNLLLTQITNLPVFAFGLGLVLFWALVLWAFSLLKPKLLSKVNWGIMVAHMTDASATFTVLSFFKTYCEQHPLTGILTGRYCAIPPIQLPDMPWMMFPIKLVVIGLVLYLLDKYTKPGEEKFRDFLKIVIFILGLALGVRDILTVSL